ncbi:MAG: glycosyltransferase family 4 protein [Methylovirgula sp.]
MREALTVVICSDFGNITGGQAKVAIESAIGLKKQGHRVIFFAATGPADKALEEAGVEIRCLEQYDLLGNPSRLAASVQGMWNRPAAAALDKLLAKMPREKTIIHVHGWAKALSPLIGMPIAESGLPAVFTLHEYFLSCPNGGFYNYRKSEVCTLTPLSPQCWVTDCDARNYARKLWRNARLLYAQKIIHLPEVFSDFITISDFQRKIVEPYIPAGARLHRLSNPVNVEDLGLKSDPTAGDVIFVGRLSPEKGAFLFAEAARKVGFVPVFIGDGPIATELAARFPQARILGWQPQERVHALMRAARALVFPSLWFEGQPLTVLEAKALGLPIVVADNCAGSDEVENGVTGLWFKGGDVDDLARALAELRDDALVTAMSHAAYRAYWTAPRSLQRHVEGLASIYHGRLKACRSAVSERQLVQNAIDPMRAVGPHKGLPGWGRH